MVVKIRLQRFGIKKFPFYHIVVCNARCFCAFFLFLFCLFLIKNTKNITEQQDNPDQ